MERTRYFRSANKFNILVDFVAGNCFPLGDDNKGPSFVPLVWAICVWSLKISYLTTVMLGTVHFANLTAEEAFKKSGALAVLSAELLIPVIYLNLRRKELRILIDMYNAILIDSDELRRLVHDTLEPYKKGLKFYIVACLGAASAWTSAPFLKLLNNDQFGYSDYSVPAYYPGEPFVPKVFAAGIMFQVIGDCSIHFGKISIDVYVSNFIAILSAEYKFCRLQLAEALRRENDEKDQLSVIIAIQKCVRHHSAVIQTGQMLANLLSLHIGATYINTILKFCFLAFGVITFGTANIEKIAYAVYSLACLIQVYLLCSCIQELLDVSTAVTDDAFHENWYARGSVVKKNFYTIQLGNQIECRLSAYRTVDLVVPTVALILSKSYSVCLLLLNVK